jgi:hypothetical protein
MLICLPKTKLIIFKQRVSSCVLPQLTEEAPLFVFLSTYLAERLGHMVAALHGSIQTTWVRFLGSLILAKLH